MSKNSLQHCHITCNQGQIIHGKWLIGQHNKAYINVKLQYAQLAFRIMYMQLLELYISSKT